MEGFYFGEQELRRPVGECTTNAIGFSVIFECEEAEHFIMEHVYFDNRVGNGTGTTDCSGDVLFSLPIYNGCTEYDWGAMHFVWDEAKFCGGSDAGKDGDSSKAGDEPRAGDETSSDTDGGDHGKDGDEDAGKDGDSNLPSGDEPRAGDSTSSDTDADDYGKDGDEYGSGEDGSDTDHGENFDFKASLGYNLGTDCTEPMEGFYFGEQELRRPVGECTTNAIGFSVIFECEEAEHFIMEHVYFDNRVGNGTGTTDCSGDVLFSLPIYNGCTEYDWGAMHFVWDEAKFCGGSDAGKDGDSSKAGDEPRAGDETGTNTDGGDHGTDGDEYGSGEGGYDDTTTEAEADSSKAGDESVAGDETGTNTDGGDYGEGK